MEGASAIPLIEVSSIRGCHARPSVDVPNFSGRMSLDAMSSTPLVLVISTTTTLNGQLSVNLPAAYTNALTAAGMIPLVLPPIDASLAVLALDGVAGLVLTGGEDIDSRWFNEPLHLAAGPTHVARDACESRWPRPLADRVCRRSRCVAARRS